MLGNIHEMYILLMVMWRVAIFWKMPVPMVILSSNMGTPVTILSNNVVKKIEFGW